MSGSRHKKYRVNAQERKKLEAAAKNLEESASDAFAAAWYFQNDSPIKGGNWMYHSLIKGLRGVNALKSFFTKEELDEAERQGQDNRVQRRRS
jgi:hypothetical protein